MVANASLTAIRGQMRGAVIRATDGISPKTLDERNARAGNLRPFAKDVEMGEHAIQRAPCPHVTARALADGLIAIALHYLALAEEVEDSRRAPRRHELRRA